MINRRASVPILVSLSMVATFCSNSRAQSQTTTTETEVWPEVDAHVQLPSRFRVLAFAGTQPGVGFPYQQWYVAAALGYQHVPPLRGGCKGLKLD